ncbi:Uncharacterised protein [Vibrio cholerae]|uniref:Uncharacterized protein n=1 Tax=Vibrio cholerae TaxID=666 RepID=A0A656AIV4_VIBCL|nr:Uncharacterised protein [Vibrio cholerae]CSA67292.1 Uncharacterised protein [Vibrio cholerae]CSA86397.1 Uncharacterised protein [Vibrio cholerae]CSB96882.1 Uncharacterised protein [Vibrio cholerae]CSD17132.1 Uncharacterised protein [Vibrio cholerae]
MLTTGIVFTLHQAAFFIGIEDHHCHLLWHRNGLGLQATTIKQHGMVRLPLRRDHLIHNAAVTTDKLVLRLLAIEGDLRLTDF